LTAARPCCARPARPLLQAALDALRLALHLAQGRALVGGVGFDLAALLAAGFKLHGEVFEGPRERG